MATLFKSNLALFKHCIFVFLWMFTVSLSLLSILLAKVDILKCFYSFCHPSFFSSYDFNCYSWVTVLRCNCSFQLGHHFRILSPYFQRLATLFQWNTHQDPKFKHANHFIQLIIYSPDSSGLILSRNCWKPQLYLLIFITLSSNIQLAARLLLNFHLDILNFTPDYFSSFRKLNMVTTLPMMTDFGQIQCGSKFSLIFCFKTLLLSNSPLLVTILAIPFCLPTFLLGACGRHYWWDDAKEIEVFPFKFYCIELSSNILVILLEFLPWRTNLATLHCSLWYWVLLSVDLYFQPDVPDWASPCPLLNSSTEDLEPRLLRPWPEDWHHFLAYSVSFQAFPSPFHTGYYYHIDFHKEHLVIILNSLVVIYNKCYTQKIFNGSSIAHHTRH